jgi:lipoprotein NlpI
MTLTGYALRARTAVVACLIAGCTRSGMSAEDLNREAINLIRRNQFDSAVVVLDQAIAKRADLADAFRNRGRAYRGKGDYTSALADFDRAVALEPGNAHVYNDRAITHQMLGHYDRALVEYTVALAKDSNHALARKNRGRAEFFMGRFAEAGSDLQRGLQLDSTNAYVAIWLYFINRRLGSPDTTQFAAQIARTDPAQWPAPVAQYYLGRLSQDSLFALSANTNSLAMRDQRCAVSFYLGEELIVKKRLAEAKRRFEEAKLGCPPSSTEYEGAVAELRRLEPEAPASAKPSGD